MTPINPNTSFVYKALTEQPKGCKPSREYLDIIKQQLYTNAAGVRSEVGGGNHGHLFVITSHTYYQTIAGVDYTIPVHPGIAPTYQNGASNAQIAATDRIFKAAQDAHHLYKGTDGALKKLLIEAIEKDYIAVLEDCLLGFTNVTSLQILDHLETTYGEYNRDERTMNTERLAKEYNPATESIKAYWKRIQDCMAYATAAGDPISDLRAIEIVVNNYE